MDNIAVFYLKSGDSVIGQLQELEEEPKMFLSACFRIVGGRPKQEPWKLEPFPLYMDKNSCLLNSENILTAGSPDPKVLAKYLEHIKEEIETTIE